jgi:predicted transcriptional regulator
MTKFKYNESTRDRLVKLVQRKRKSQDLSVYAAAKQSDINQSTWHRIEAGEIKPTLYSLFHMLEVLGSKVEVHIN